VKEAQADVFIYSIQVIRLINTESEFKILFQVMDVYDAKGQIAQCLILLVRRAQKWVVTLGHEGVYRNFVEGLDALVDPIRVHENWGTPEHIRAWLTAKGAGEDADEPQFAAQFAFTGSNDAAGNPLAQEKEKSKDLENVLIQRHKFKQYIPRNEEVVLSQYVSAASCNMP
jgi:hypothetical protein